MVRCAKYSEAVLNTRTDITRNSEPGHKSKDIIWREINEERNKNSRSQKRVKGPRIIYCVSEEQSYQ